MIKMYSSVAQRVGGIHYIDLTVIVTLDTIFKSMEQHFVFIWERTYPIPVECRCHLELLIFIDLTISADISTEVKAELVSENGIRQFDVNFLQIWPSVQTKVAVPCWLSVMP